MSRNVLMIDNRDSFTFNVVEAFGRLGAAVCTVGNRISPDDALGLAVERNALIVISPGPGRPEQAGCSMELIARAKGRVPLLGICLGHQALVLEAGGSVERAANPVHGKSSLVEHDGEGMFAGVPSPLRIGRYHSLCTPGPPARFKVHAWLEGMAMALSDREALQAGVQFHPESLLTPGGEKILANALAMGTIAAAV